MRKVVLSMIALLASSPIYAAEPLNLICTGAATTDESSPTVGAVYGPGGTAYVVGSSTHHASIEDTVTIRFAADGTGTALLPRKIFPQPRDGWFKLKKILIGVDVITADVPYGLIGKARLRLDRIAGRVTIQSANGDFTGACEPYDPETVERKF